MVHHSLIFFGASPDTSSNLWQALNFIYFLPQHIQVSNPSFDLPSSPCLSGFVCPSACQCRRHRRCGFDLWVGKITWRRAWQPTPVFLPGESYGQRILVAYSP